MDALSGYEPADLLMFSPETYYRLFELTNAALWPAQILALGAGLAILALMLRGPLWRGHSLLRNALWRGHSWRGRAIAALLAAAWGAVAWMYFLERYAQINLAAPVFAYGFIAQAVLLVISGVALGRLTFGETKPICGKPIHGKPFSGKPRAAKAGIALFIYSLLVQPLTGPLLGRPWSGAELFGIAPDPTALATLGVVLASDRVPAELLALPVLWCAVTGATLWTMGSPEWWFMPLAAAIALSLLAYRRLTKLSRG